MRIRLKHDRLAALLAESQVSQNHWAIRLGLSSGHLSDIVNGRHPYVSAKTRARLLDTLDVPFDELFEIETPPSAVGARETDPVAQAKLLSTPIAPPPHSPPGGVMSGLLDDLRYAWRLAGRKRIASAAVIMTLALGVSVTTAVFSIVNGLMLKPLPFEESSRVVRLSTLLRTGNSTIMNALPDLEDYRHATTLSDVSGVFLSGATLTEGDAPHQSFDPLRGPRIRRCVPDQTGGGSVFRARRCYRFDAPRVVMLSQELWRQQFGGDPTMVGHAVSINNEPVTVIGILPVMPYVYPSFPDVGFVAPLRPVPNSSQGTRGALWLRAAARLKPGVTIDQAQSEIATIAASIARAFPEAAGGRGVRLESLHGVETRDVGAMLGLLSVTVAAVMLIACVNVANLLLGQAAARSGEFAVRAALGAGSWRLHRQIVTECSFLAAIGGAFGLAVTPVLTRTLLTFDPDTLPRVGEIGMDGRVLIVGIGMALAAGVAASMPIVRRALSRDLSRDLRQGGRAGSIRGQRRTGRGTDRLAGRDVRRAPFRGDSCYCGTLHTLQTTDPGFTSADITTFQVIAPSARYPALRDAQRYLREASQALLALPGVSAIATASEMPYTGNAEWNSFVIRERGDRGRDNPQIRVATVVSPQLLGHARRATQVGPSLSTRILTPHPESRSSTRPRPRASMPASRPSAGSSSSTERLGKSSGSSGRCACQLWPNRRSQSCTCHHGRTLIELLVYLRRITPHLRTVCGRYSEWSFAKWIPPSR